ncbi:MAG: choice-of-anchor D domain-containing protein [Myxococcota bacterium]|nr:choice-of-anchor D domain-containing protein [Myxococcota bacterium]
MFLMLLACSDHGLNIQTDDPWAGDPAIEVTPPTLDFLTQDLGEVTEREVEAFSVGVGVLSIQGLRIEGDEGFSVDEETYADLLPGESLQIPVSFTPSMPGPHSATLFVLSDDPERPEVEVALSGDGLTPWLVVTPSSHDYGEELLGCPMSETLVVQNVGNADLELSAIETLSSEAFTVVELPELPTTLTPGAWLELPVQWEPSTIGSESGGQRFVSNDPRGDLQVTQQGVGLATDTATDSFTITGDPPVDIVFAVDQSGSMDNDAASLALNFEGLITTLEGVTNNWHIGVVTYDDGCFNHGVLSADTENLGGLFAEAVTMGTDREVQDDEALFKLLDRALLQLEGCNAGFRREGALFHTVFVSDEPERSSEQASAWTWEYFHERYTAVVPDSLLMVSGVIDADDCNEGDDGYAEMIAETSGLSMSICSPDWSAYAEDIANASLTHRWTFTLSQDAAAGTIVVLVDGVETSAWSYDAAQNAVLLEEGRDGQSVEVQYSVQTECLN